MTPFKPFQPFSALHNSVLDALGRLLPYGAPGIWYDQGLTEDEVAALTSVYMLFGSGAPYVLARIETFATVDTLVLAE